MRYTTSHAAGFLKCDATVSDVAAAFATEVRMYTSTDSGQSVLGYSGSASLPTELSAAVYHVAGLSNFYSPTSSGVPLNIDTAVPNANLRGSAESDGASSVPADAIFTTIPDWLRKQYNNRVCFIYRSIFAGNRSAA